MDGDLREDYNPHYEMDSVCFRWYTAEEIRKMSVKEMCNTELFDNLNHPAIGGLHDHALGLFTRTVPVC